MSDQVMTLPETTAYKLRATALRVDGRECVLCAGSDVDLHELAKRLMPSNIKMKREHIKTVVMIHAKELETQNE